MKRMIPILLLLLAAGLILIKANDLRNNPTKQQQAVEPDGTVKDNSDPDAPKAIESTFIVTFDCEFSTLDLETEDTALAGAVYHLEARFADGAVKCRYRAEGPHIDTVDIPFRQSHTFLYDIQEIVAAYDLAQYNGRSIHVSGLPDPYGASLSVRYKSQETISASDNQDNFLSVEAMEALEALFRSQIQLP